MRISKLAPLAVVAGALALPATAAAHPEACEAAAKAGVSGGFTFAGATFGPKDDDGDFCFSKSQISKFNDRGAKVVQEGDVARSQNVKHLANLPKTGPFAGEPAFGSDLAFWGKYAFQGNYNGFQITDISNPEKPAIVSQVSCPGSQNDISVWKNLVFLSTDSRRTNDGCDSTALAAPASTDPNAEYWEGIKVFDWSNPKAPKLVSSVETDCGSHTHTIIPQADRVLTYVSSYDLNVNAKDCRNTGSKNDHDKISIVETPLSNPAASSVVKEVVLFPDGGFTANAGTPLERETRGCHDITVYPALDLAAGACMGEGIIMDISDPLNPDVVARVNDPNFAFWHSATFTHDGKAVVFTDELGGGGQPTCNPTVGPTRGANIIYDLSSAPSRPVKQSYFKIPRTQTNTENCVAHNGNFIPTSRGDIYVQAWYQGGTSFVDMTDKKNPKEVGFFDRGPLSTERLILGGSWSSYYYNGFVYSNDIQKGLDVLKFADPRGASASANKVPYLNAQVQEPLRKK